jgi:hypothetical protein
MKMILPTVLLIKPNSVAGFVFDGSVFTDLESAIMGTRKDRKRLISVVNRKRGFELWIEPFQSRERFSLNIVAKL